MLEKLPKNNSIPSSNENRLTPIQEQILSKKSFVDRMCKKYLNIANRLDMAGPIANEVMMKAIRSSTTYNNQSSLETWLAGISINTVRDHLRKTKRDPIDAQKTFDIADFDYKMEDPSLDPEELFLKKEKDELSVKIIRDALQKLPIKTREVLELELNGLSYNEIAEKLNIPMGTVKSRASRARREIATLLGQSTDFKLKRKKKYD